MSAAVGVWFKCDRCGERGHKECLVRFEFFGQPGVLEVEVPDGWCLLHGRTRDQETICPACRAKRVFEVRADHPELPELQRLWEFMQSEHPSFNGTAKYFTSEEWEQWHERYVKPFWEQARKILPEGTHDYDWRFDAETLTFIDHSISEPDS